MLIAASAALVGCPTTPSTPYDPGPAGERCSDAVDNDGDGLTDCADDDCEPNPLCHLGDEACDDGWDNDLDGLVDCEDGDCAAVCTPEVCDNGVDDDDDGLVDCADPDCVGGDCAATLRSQVVAVDAVRTRVEFRSWGASCSGVDSSFYGGSASMVAYAVEGWLERVPQTGGPAVQCDWGADLAEHGWSWSALADASGTVTFRPAARQGFWVEEGCGTSGSAFLPDYLLPAQYSGAPIAYISQNPARFNSVSTGGPSWYRGYAGRTDSWSSYTDGTCNGGYTFGVTHGYGSRIDAVQPGAVYEVQR